MAKKKPEKPTGPYKEARRAVRLFLTEEEYHLVRVRAAERHMPMSEFCRQAAVKEARGADR